MKVTVTFAGDDQGPKTSLKLDLPTKWLDGPMSKVLQTFVSTYNKKNPATPLDEVHLVTNGGQPIAEDTIVGKAAVNGDEIFVVRGKVQQTGAPTASAAAPPVSRVVANGENDEDDVTTKEGLEKAKQKSQFAFDYSKWDKLDLSDDDGVDCHPNIELASWKRIKAQQRAERRAKEEAEIGRLKEKIAKHEARARAHEGRDEAVRQEALTQMRKYQQQLDDFLAKRKWVADEVCETKEDRSMVSKVGPVIPPPGAEETKSKVVGPVSPDAEFATYDSYIKQHEAMVKEYVAIENNREASEKFMVEHPAILNQHADGYLLLLCLDTAMRHAAVPVDKKTPKMIESEKKELRRVVRQHLLLNYVLELAKLSKVDDVRAAVRPFFLKTSKQSKEQAEEFEKELSAFITRIENRAQEKLAKGEKSPLAKKNEVEDEDDYEPAGLGPGGLDPTEVLQSLPKEMQQAFVEQDVQRLKDILSSMPPEEADHHLKRCIASGLWVVPGGGDDDDEEEEEEGQTGETDQ